MSEDTNELVTALIAAQMAITGVDRNREVTVKPKKKGDYQPPSYKFKYATLDNIIAHIRGPLTDHGPWFVQRVEGGQMITRILHSSGQWMDAGVPMPNVSGTPQEIGAIISYFKRYSLSAAFAIVTEEDDDAGSTVEAGERSVDFYSNRRDQPHHTDQPKVEEPPMGWGDWARGLIDTVKGKASEEELDQLRDTNLDWINGADSYDKTMARAIREAFRARRSVIGNGPI